MANAVIVIDMTRGFMEKGYPLYCGEKATRIIPNIQRLLEKELASGSKIFFLNDCHAPNDVEFKMFPPSCRGRNQGG
jgi:nicotinamidase/pyrazinamidase